MDNTEMDCTVRVDDGETVRMVGPMNKVKKIVLQMQTAASERWQVFNASEAPPESAYYLVYVPLSESGDDGDLLDIRYWNDDDAEWHRGHFSKGVPSHWKQLPAMPTTTGLPV